MKKIASILLMLLGVAIAGLWMLFLACALRMESLGHALLLILLLALLFPLLSIASALITMSIFLWHRP